MDTGLDGPINFSPEIFEQGVCVVGRWVEVSDFAHIFSLDVAKNHAGSMLSNHTVDFIGRARSREIENSSTSFQAASSDFRLVGFHRDQGTCPREWLKDGEKGLDLLLCVCPGGMSEGGLGAQVNEMGSLRL